MPGKCFTNGRLTKKQLFNYFIFWTVSPTKKIVAMETLSSFLLNNYQKKPFFIPAFNLKFSFSFGNKIFRKQLFKMFGYKIFIISP
jgi:hypothetical protein